MPFKSAVDESRALFHFRAEGVITDDECLEILERAYLHPASQEGMRALWDISGFERLDVTPTGIRAMVGTAERLAPKRFRAAVITNNPVVHGMARMYELIRLDSGQETRIFKTVADAAEWFEVAPEDLPAID